MAATGLIADFFSVTKLSSHCQRRSLPTLVWVQQAIAAQRECIPVLSKASAVSLFDFVGRESGGTTQFDAQRPSLKVLKSTSG